MTYQVDSYGQEWFEDRLSKLPIPLHAIIQDEEFLRHWPILYRDQENLFLNYGTGAICALKIQKENIISAKLIEGNEARKILAQYSYHPSEETSRRVKQIFNYGKNIDAALDTAFPRRLGITKLQRDQSTNKEHYYRINNEGVLKFITAKNGQSIESYAWIVGEQALQLIEDHELIQHWSVPLFEKQNIKVRTSAEALLYVYIQGGYLLEQRKLESLLQIRAQLPNGKCLFTFLPEQFLPFDSTDLGLGTSSVLDPGELLQFATTISTRFPNLYKVHQEEIHKLQIAITAIKQIIQFIQEDEDFPPLDTFRSPKTKKMIESLKQRFHRKSLENFANKIEQMWIHYIESNPSKDT